METVSGLKEALLELYLSVKIRSDEEIENYNEAQYKFEKEQMRQMLDGYALVDHVKAAIEQLMNLKTEMANNNYNEFN